MLKQVNVVTPSGNEDDLQAYHIALSKLDSTINRLRTLTIDNPEQQKNITLLEELIPQKLETLKQAFTTQN